MDRDEVDRWLADYVAAWKSYERSAIEELFSEDVTYRYHPYDEPIVGREGVVASWLGEDESGDASSRDTEGTYDASYRAVAVDGDTAVATGSSNSAVTLNGQAQGGALHFTRVYVKRNGAWKMIVSHATTRQP